MSETVYNADRYLKVDLEELGDRKCEFSISSRNLYGAQFLPRTVLGIGASMSEHTDDWPLSSWSSAHRQQLCYSDVCANSHSHAGVTLLVLKL